MQPTKMIALRYKIYSLFVLILVCHDSRQESSTGGETGHVRIVGGSLTSIEYHPYQAALYVNRSSKMGFNCGGSIISSEWILTAAHCCFGESNIYVKGGNANICVGDYIGETEKIIIHPKYSSFTFKYDACLLKMKSELPLNGKTIAPVTLADNNENIYTGEPVRITGWGTTYSGGKGVCNLMGVNLLITDHDKCNNDYMMKLTTHICASVKGGGKDACQGDSGGPLVTRSKPIKQIGIVSFGIGCAEEHYPGAYTSVPYVRNWIRNITGV